MCQYDIFYADRLVAPHVLGGGPLGDARFCLGFFDDDRSLSAALARRIARGFCVNQLHFEGVIGYSFIVLRYFYTSSARLRSQKYPPILAIRTGPGPGRR